MQFLAFIIIYPLVWLISILPMRVLYVISDVIYVLIFYVFKYRKKVVAKNLKLAFPQKSERERNTIQKKFFAHFVDIFVEMIKSFTISEKELARRYAFSNLDVLKELEAEKKSIILMGAHYANWEWIFILNKYINFEGVAAFRRIGNRHFDKKIRTTRKRFGTSLVVTSKLIELLKKNKKENKLAIYGLLSDQSPQLSKTKYWSEFFGVKVPMHTGGEFLAKKHDFSVVMVKTRKIKRGYYTTEFVVLAKKPQDFKDYKITDMFTKEIESLIKERPELYFWSHNRYKHMDKLPT